MVSCQKIGNLKAMEAFEGMLASKQKKIAYLAVSSVLILSLFIFSDGSAYSQSTPKGKVKPTIKIGTAHFPPFRIFENGELSGSDAEIVKEVFSRMGYSTEFEIAPFKRVYAMASSGELSAIFTMTRNPERDTLFFFSDPISKVMDVFFIHKDTKLDWSSFHDLKGLTVGMSLGYSYPEPFLNALDANIFTPDRVASAEPEIIHLRKIQQKRIDLAICEVSVCSWIISRDKAALGSVTYMKKPIADARTFHMGFSKKWPEAEKVTKAFNKELAKYIAEGKRRAVFKKYNMAE
jgi:polar amino acid transport system substrate-binding protein